MFAHACLLVHFTSVFSLAKESLGSPKYLDFSEAWTPSRGAHTRQAYTDPCGGSRRHQRELLFWNHCTILGCRVGHSLAYQVRLSTRKQYVSLFTTIHELVLDEVHPCH